MNMAEITALDLITLGIAVFGALTGLAALLWQIAQHALTGPRIQVALKSAMLGPGGAVVAREDRAWSQAEALAPNGYSTPAYAVSVINRGRFPASVDSIVLTVGGGMGFRPIGELLGSQLPCSIDGGGAETWYVNAQSVWATEEASVGVLGTPRRGVMASATLADGRVSKSRRIPVLAFDTRTA
jgi:hypothetical protein